ncbi:15129_t:CDS:1, partial [Gigaspora margarita]
ALDRILRLNENDFKEFTDINKVNNECESICKANLKVFGKVTLKKFIANSDIDVQEFITK